MNGETFITVKSEIKKNTTTALSPPMQVKYGQNITLLFHTKTMRTD